MPSPLLRRENILQNVLAERVWWRCPSLHPHGMADAAGLVVKRFAAARDADNPYVLPYCLLTSLHRREPNLSQASVLLFTRAGQAFHRKAQALPL